MIVICRRPYRRLTVFYTLLVVVSACAGCNSSLPAAKEFIKVVEEYNRSDVEYDYLPELQKLRAKISPADAKEMLEIYRKQLAAVEKSIPEQRADLEKGESKLPLDFLATMLRYSEKQQKSFKKAIELLEK